MRLPLNRRDAACVTHLTSQHYRTTSRGWPHYMAWPKSGGLPTCVYILRGQQLKPKQYAVACALSEAGMLVQIFTGSALRIFRPEPKGVHQ